MDYGVPQNRPRLYIIGIKDADTPRYDLDIPHTYRYNLSHYIDTSLPSTREKCLIPRRKDCLEWALANYNINMQDDWCINIGASLGTFITAMKDISPCILTFCPYYYLTKYERFLQPQELLALQGFPDSYPLHSSKSKQYKQIGNAMSVNVLYHIFYRLLCWQETVQKLCLCNIKCIICNQYIHISHTVHFHNIMLIKLAFSNFPDSRNCDRSKIECMFVRHSNHGVGWLWQHRQWWLW